MSKSFISYVWSNSARWQIIILIMTGAYFPFLYLTLDLPKQIINDAIGGENFPVTIFGFEFNQLQYLLGLCFAYLCMVLASGMLKMKTNTFKGILGERLLRRFRNTLITRIIRFPLPKFKQISQGSLISMVNAESELISPLMGEAFATPIFAGGQMITILVFLFVQNFWLGVAAVAMIPVQAYIVPKMQKRINLLNRGRILEVRKFSEHISETVNGAEDIRANGGIMYTLAKYTSRFANQYKFRLEVYERKFFMKFVNNTINQLTPFYLLLIGGYLVIEGQLTIGALAAALASYKDLLGPWKELLAYYSQIQDTSLRYTTIIDQFDPPGMIDEKLFFGKVDKMPDWRGEIELKAVTVNDNFGLPIISGISGRFKAGSHIAIQAESNIVRQALSRAMSRSILLLSGSILIDGDDLSGVHQDVIASKIGVVSPSPGLFEGNVAYNTQIALWRNPPKDGLSKEQQAIIKEAMVVGNSTDPSEGSWLDLSSAVFKNEHELKDWWVEIVKAVGLQKYFQAQSLKYKLSEEQYPDLAQRIVEIRPKIAERLRAEQMENTYYRFSLDEYNPALTPVENALFCLPNSSAQTIDGRINPQIWIIIQEMGLAEFHELSSYAMLETLVQTFGAIGTDHPMFQRLENVSADSFEQLKEIYTNKQRGLPISEDDKALVRALPLNVTAEQMGEAFPEELKERILTARRNNSGEVIEKSEAHYRPIDEGQYMSSLSILENLLFGKMRQGAELESIQQTIMEELQLAEISRDVELLIGDLETEFSASNLEMLAVEGIAFVRALIKKPQILIIDTPFSGAPGEIVSKYHANIRNLLPDTTIIELNAEFDEKRDYDKRYQIRDGRMTEIGAEQTSEVDMIEPTSGATVNELDRKIRILTQVELLSNLDQSQLRLLAFGAKWFEKKKGQYFFKKDDAADGAYIFTSGTAELIWPTGEGKDEVIGVVEPGKLVGDLAVIMKKGRSLGMLAQSDVVGLKIDSQDLTDIIENDAGVATSLLRTVAGYLQDAGQRISDREQMISQLKATGTIDEKDALSD